MSIQNCWSSLATMGFMQKITFLYDILYKVEPSLKKSVKEKVLFDHKKFKNFQTNIFILILTDLRLRIHNTFFSKSCSVVYHFVKRAWSQLWWKFSYFIFHFWRVQRFTIINQNLNVRWMPSYMQNADLTIFCNEVKDRVIVLFTYTFVTIYTKSPVSSWFFSSLIQQEHKQNLVVVTVIHIFETLCLLFSNQYVNRNMTLSLFT